LKGLEKEEEQKDLVSVQSKGAERQSPTLNQRGL